MSASKQKKDAQAGDQTDRKLVLPKDKMIRLDDLIPKQNVRGGGKLFFGAADTQQPTQKQKDK